MANEVRGLLYETITHYALLKAIQASNISGEVFWNEKPDDMSINPDFTIGQDKNNVSHIILVTASGSSRNAEMKSWRNWGETFEAKSQLPQVPIAINLYYKSEVKKGLSEAVDSLYDSTVHFDTKKYFATIKNWVENNIGLAGSTKELRAEHFEHAIASNVELASSIELLIKDITTVLTVENLQLDSLWSLMSDDYQSALLQAPFSARNTFVKRGIGKLMVLEPDVRECLYKNYKKSGGIKGSLPSYCFELGFFTKTLAGARLVDDEIKNVISLLQKQQCEGLIQQCNNRMRDWASGLRASIDIQMLVECLKLRWDEITGATGLFEFIKSVESDPLFGLRDLDLEQTPATVWVLYLLFDVLKSSESRRQGFGLSVLAEEAQQYLPHNSYPPSNRVWTIVLSDYINRIGNEVLPAEVLLAICKVLTKRIKNIDVTNLSTLTSSIQVSHINSVLEQKLLPYRKFEPILWLLESELKKHDVEYDAKGAYIGWINEYADVGKRSATTPFVRVGNTYIHWKTVSDAGRGHKKKELAARARAFKYQYDVESEQFIHRNGLDKLVLLVDGTFDDKDLRALQTSGWDLILYPDEISGFVADLAK